MGWCTEALVKVCFYKETFNTKEDVLEYIEARNDVIEYVQKKLGFLIVITEPQKYCPKDSDPLMWFQHEYKNCLDMLQTALIEKNEAELVLGGWEDMHNPDGKAKNEPSEFDKLRRICGDYVVIENNND